MVVVVIGYGTRTPKEAPPTPPLLYTQTSSKEYVERCGAPTPDGRPIRIAMLFSDDKQAWIEDAADRFSRICSNIQIELFPMSDIEAAHALAEGRLRPMLWSPSDEIFLRYVDHRSRMNSGKPLLLMNTRRSLLKTPVVWMIWESRYRTLEKILSRSRVSLGPWAQVACALVSPEPVKGWLSPDDMVPGDWDDWLASAQASPANENSQPLLASGTAQQGFAQAPSSRLPPLHEVQSWGRVKFGHTDPRRTSTGLATLYLMALDFVSHSRKVPESPIEAPQPAPPATDSGLGSIPELEAQGIDERESSGATPSEMAKLVKAQRPLLLDWLRRCKAGTRSSYLRSARQLSLDMFIFGPTRYDAVATDEQLTIPILRESGEHAGSAERLRVIYPDPTVFHEHPLVMLQQESEIRPELRAAIGRWTGFLLSVQMQNRAIELGFRPSGDVSPLSYRADSNPFLQMRPFGIEPVIPAQKLARIDGDAIGELLKIWSEATGLY